MRPLAYAIALAQILAATAGLAQTSMPAVDGFNGKLEWSSGVQSAVPASAKNVIGITGVGGVMSMPLGNSFGLQIDGAVDWSRYGLQGGGAGHLFWRDPGLGMVGAYGAAQHVASTGLYHVAGEGELYLGRFTIGALVGSQFAGRINEFFDHVALAYYPTDNLKLTAGHVYSVSQHAVTASVEYMPPQFQAEKTAVSVFAQGLIGEKGHSILGGIRFYFGTKPKSLIRRHREDDPAPVLSVAQMQSLAALRNQRPVAPGPAAPPINIAQTVAMSQQPSTLTLHNIQQQMPSSVWTPPSPQSVQDVLNILTGR